MYCPGTFFRFLIKEGWNGWLSFYCRLLKVSRALMANWEVAKFAFLKLQFDAAQRAEKVGKFAYDASSFFCRTHSVTRRLSREGKHVTRRKVRRARKWVKTVLNAAHIT
jgi:hypothetical protein